MKDSLARYYDEVGKYPLLTREEEIALAARIKIGGTEGREARNLLPNSNLRLVIKML